MKRAPIRIIYRYARAAHSIRARNYLYIEVSVSCRYHHPVIPSTPISPGAAQRHTKTETETETETTYLLPTLKLIAKAKFPSRQRPCEGY